MADCSGFGNIDFLVQLTGLSDAGLRLILALFSAYPLAFIYHAFFYRKNPVLQHAFFMFCGLCIAAFCYGWCFAHSMITIVSSYLLLHTIGPSIVMVVSMFLFNMTDDVPLTEQTVAQVLQTAKDQLKWSLLK